jgi:hypothetical protein
MDSKTLVLAGGGGAEMRGSKQLKIPRGVPGKARLSHGTGPNCQIMALFGADGDLRVHFQLAQIRGDLK